MYQFTETARPSHHDVSMKNQRDSQLSLLQLFLLDESRSSSFVLKLFNFLKLTFIEVQTKQTKHK